MQFQVMRTNLIASHLNFAVLIPNSFPNRSDDQWVWVLNIFILIKAEVGIESLSENEASERLNMRPGLHIIEGDLTLLIIHKKKHLGLLTENDGFNKSWILFTDLYQHPESILRV